MSFRISHQNSCGMDHPRTCHISTVPEELLQHIFDLTPDTTFDVFSLVCYKWLQIVRLQQFSYLTLHFGRTEACDPPPNLRKSVAFPDTRIIRCCDRLQSILGPKAPASSTIPWSHIARFTLLVDFPLRYVSESVFSHILEDVDMTVTYLTHHTPLNPESLKLHVVGTNAQILHSPRVRDTIRASFPRITRLHLVLRQEHFADVFSFIPLFQNLRVLELSCDTLFQSVTQTMFSNTVLPVTLETAHIDVQSLTRLAVAYSQSRDQTDLPAVESDISLIGSVQKVSLEEPRSHVSLRHLSLLNCHDKAFGDALIHLGMLESVAIGFPNDMKRFKAIQEKAKLPISRSYRRLSEGSNVYRTFPI
jgi:hypothetical protein